MRFFFVASKRKKSACTNIIVLDCDSFCVCVLPNDLRSDMRAFCGSNLFIQQLKVSHPYELLSAFIWVQKQIS